MVERVMVQFAGDGAGEEELSWGQRELWDLMKHTGSWLPIGAVRPLPPGVSVAQAVSDLHFVMCHYPSMRTRLRIDPDGPKQVASASGEIGLEIIDVPDGEDPAEAAGQTFARYQSEDYDYRNEWPVRMAVVRHRGALTHRVWVMCHLVTDGHGAAVLVRELEARDTSGSRAALTAIEQARWQRSPAGQRQCQAALAHWEKVLRAQGACQFPARGEQPTPRYWRGTFDSPATDLAVRAISDRVGAEPVSVLLTMFATALARVVPVNSLVIQLVTNNRFRPQLGQSVSPLMQAAPCLLEIPDGTVDDAVRRVRSRALASYKYAYYDPTKLDAVIARVGEERGTELEIECGFNDRRLEPREEPLAVPTTRQIEAALPAARFEWVERQDDEPYTKLYVNVEDSPASLLLTITADTHYLSPAQVEACARGIEEVAVEAAIDSGTRTKVLTTIKES